MTTTFTIKNGEVIITRHDQPECVVPIKDLVEFIGKYLSDEVQKAF